MTLTLLILSLNPLHFSALALLTVHIFEVHNGTQEEIGASTRE